MQIFDHVDGVYVDVEVIESKTVENAQVHRVALDDVGEFLVIIYTDGTQYTQHDWQSRTAEIPEDLSEVQWVRQDGTPGVMLNGLPRNF